MDKNARNMSLNKLYDDICSYYGLVRNDVSGSFGDRHKPDEFVTARRMFSWLAYNNITKNRAEIARVLGDYNRSTVYYHIQKFGYYMTKSEQHDAKAIMASYNGTATKDDNYYPNPLLECYCTIGRYWWGFAYELY